MKIRELLDRLDDVALESLAADKIDDVIHLRLPREVLIDEIADTIASYSYVTEAIGKRHPPCFEILDLLMKADDFRVPINGFKSSVHSRISEISSVADSDDALALPKDYELYTRILEAAWENDRVVDSSESSLLTALRRELGISFREHVVLEHSSRIRSYWKAPDAYERERNHLLASGVLHTDEDSYVLPEELPQLIREAWSIDLSQADYRRLLDHLTTDQLYGLLGDYGLKVAGSKDERIHRLVDNYVEPRELLDRLTIGELRDLARDSGCRVSGSKAEVIENLLAHFVKALDLEEEEAEADEPEEIEPEPNVLSGEEFRKLFRELTVENLYEVAGQLDRIPKSGTKRERIEAMWGGPYSEPTLLEALTNAALTKVLRGLELPVSGPKAEKVARLLDWAGSREDQEPGPEEVGDLAGTDDAEQVSGPGPERAPEKPEGFDDIQSRYPYLDEDQQTVLSVLRQLRSLNEQELDRLVARYDLDWFLTKAEMAELVETLDDHGTPVVRIQARGDHNVYEYVEA